MAEQSIGAARVDLVVDTTQFEAAISAAKNSVSGMSTAAQAEYSKLTSAQRRQVDGLIRQANTLGLTRQQQILYNATLRGTPTAILDELKTKLAAAGTAASVASKDFVRSGTAASTAVRQLNQYGISAAQQAAALRGVPAQLTDIFVSLQGGQAPLTVLLQQGGQLKDMFGGIVPAARALGGAVLGLVNPYTLAAAAVGGLYLAYEKGAQEGREFDKALILTGGYAGVTSDQLAEMADRVGGLVGNTGKAANALAQAVGTGRIFGKSLEDVASAAVLMEKATGQAIDETISQFVRLAQDPAKASADLNEQFHYLTASTQEQIRNLQELGRTDEAAALAQRTYSNAVKSRAGEVIENVGYMERAWSSLWGVVKGTWDAMKDVGRQGDPLVENITRLRTEIARVEERQNGPIGPLNSEGRRRLDQAKVQLQLLEGQLQTRRNIARAQALATQAEEKAAAQATNRENYLKARKGTSREALLEDETKAFQKATEGLKSGTAEYESVLKAHNDRVAQINKQFAGRAFTDSAADKTLQQLREREASLRAQTETVDKLSASERERTKYVQLFADLKEKKVLTADQKSLLANESAIRAQLAKNVALEQENRLKQEGVKLDALRQSLSAQLASDSQQYADRLATTSLGPRAREEVQAQQRLYEDYRRQSLAAAQQVARGDLTQAGYANQMEALRQSLADRLSVQQQYYSDLRALESDWRVGLQSGLAEYAETAANAAELSRSAFATGFQAIEDLGVNAITKLELNFRSLGEAALSVFQDIARMIVRQNVTGPAANFLGSALNGMLGSLSGNWSSTNASNPWSLSSLGLLGKAGGGPTNPGQFYEVNEKGPELYTEGGRTFLMSGAKGGYVTPITPSFAAQNAGGPPISIHNYGGAEVEVQRMSDGEIRAEIDRRIASQTPRVMDQQASNPNSRFSRQMSRSTTVQRRR